MSSIPIEIASTIQSASINRHPSPDHDINPSTAASSKIPVRPAPSIDDDASSQSSPPSSPSAIPLRPIPRRTNLPPLPDLRFEQSYLASIPAGASWGRVAYITTRDQVLLPLVQGTMWALVLTGWRHWNRGANMVGHSVGARIRRWWWDVNGWEVPAEAKERAKAAEIKDVCGVSYYRLTRRG